MVFKAEQEFIKQALRHETNRSRQLKEKLNLVIDRLQHVQRIAQLGYWDWNLVSKGLYWSEEVYTILGLEPRRFEATYESFLGLVHPDDRSMVEQAVSEAVSEGKKYDIEHRVVRPDSSVIYVKEQGQIVRDPDGTPKRMLGTIMNITDGKDSVRAKSQHESEFQALWEASADGMITVDTGGIITLVNKAAESMFGYSRDELIGKSVEMLVPENFRKSHEKYRAEYFDKPYKREMGKGLELFGQDSKGNKFPLEISLTPIRIRNGPEILVEIQNIAKRKALEEKLHQSQKLEAVGLLAGGIAHDLNNIFTAILGFAELVELQVGSEHPAHSDIGEIKKAGGKAKAMVSKIMAFSRQQVLEPKLVNVNELIENSDKLIRQLVPNTIELDYQLEKELHRTFFDPTQLEQIILNLVTNSVDAMEGGGRLVVSTGNINLHKDDVIGVPIKNGGRYVQLSVSDTGVGMSEEMVNRIFDPFFTTKENGKGTGLGLATVYGIIKQSKGEIGVFSEPGYGTTINIYFPIFDTRTDKVEAQQPKRLRSVKGARILLIDDDTTVRALTKRILETEGYVVSDYAYPGDVLENLLEIGEVDLIISDVVLGTMTGPELYNKLKASYTDTPALFISGFAGTAIDSLNILKGRENFMRKPFSSRELLERTSMLLNR